MGSSTLPLHHREGKALLPKALSSPRKVLSLVFLLGFVLYILSSSSQFSDSTLPTHLPSTDYLITSSFWPVGLDLEKSAYSQLTKDELKSISAVILRVTDDDSILASVEHLSKYPFIQHIYIQNLIDKPLDARDFKLHQPVSIEISQPKENLKSMARFTTCATAADNYCYFQDDNYINPFMDTLYTNFIRYPGLIHANAKPSHYETEMNWRFQNKEWKLHAGYADFRYGAYVPRYKVQTFLTQLGKSSLDKRHIQEAEVYFPIWVNQYPWLLNNQVLTSNHVKVTDQDVAYPSQLNKYTYDAVHYLQRKLEADLSETPQDYFDRFEEQPPVEYRETKASCGNDKCLFMTNMDPFASPNQVDFDHRTTKSISALESAYGKLAKTKKWEENGYHRAVDSDPNTCWNTIKGPKQGDYFGLVIMGSVKTKQLSIITPQEMAHPQKVFSISVLHDKDWVRCTSHDETVASSGHVKLSFKCGGADLFRAIKISFLKDQKEAFELCGLSLNDFTV